MNCLIFGLVRAHFLIEFEIIDLEETQLTFAFIIGAAIFFTIFDLIMLRVVFGLLFSKVASLSGVAIIKFEFFSQFANHFVFSEDYLLEALELLLKLLAFGVK